MNNRRKLIIALGAGALGASFRLLAQPQAKVWRVGFLALPSRPASFDSHFYGAFVQGMRELGYVEGKNLIVEWRFADGKAERLSSMAAELVQMRVDVILAGNTTAVRAAQKSTATIPIVMGTVGDPVGYGFVKSLAHPGGNITGPSSLAGDLGPKHLEMLLSMVPKLSRVAVLVNPSNPNHTMNLKKVEAVAQGTRVKILPVEASTPQEIENAFSVMTREKAGAVIMVGDAVFSQQVRQIAELATKHRLPSIYVGGEYVEAGGLMSYGQSFAERFRRAATYVDKIFKGAKPGDIPVEQPTKFELFINGRTAKALGLTIPQSLLISADKVIE